MRRFPTAFNIGAGRFYLIDRLLKDVAEGRSFREPEWQSRQALTQAVQMATSPLAIGTPTASRRDSLARRAGDLATSLLALIPFQYGENVEAAIGAGWALVTMEGGTRLSLGQAETSLAQAIAQYFDQDGTPVRAVDSTLRSSSWDYYWRCYACHVRRGNWRAAKACPQPAQQLLGQILVDEGILVWADVTRARAFAAQTPGMPLGEAAIALSLASPDDIGRALTLQQQQF